MQLSRRTFLSSTACALAALAAPSLVWGETAESVSASEAVSASESASTSVASGSYTVGLQEHGFTLTEMGYMDSIKATKLLFTHDATGAKIYFFKNDDPNRTFQVAFQTAPSDDSGKLHILEHTACLGSDDYPGRDVFLSVLMGCYVTNMNATTYNNATRFYVASLDEEELAAVTDFLMDCAWHSAVAIDENYFKSDAWRYVLDDADADLTITGIVYNEMRGSMSSLSNVAENDIQKTLFPDTAQHFKTGGIPDDIRNLKYEDLVDFYHSAYQPSNSTSMFYGDVDVERFLTIFDEKYFAGFDDTPTTAAAMQAQEPFDEPVKATFDFPASSDATSLGSQIDYAVALPADIGFQSECVIKLAIAVLNSNSSTLMQALYASGIGSSYRIDQTYVGPQLEIFVEATDADPSRADEFKQITLDSIAQAIDEGLDSDLIANAYTKLVMDEKLLSNQSDVGVAMASRVARSVNDSRPDLIDPLTTYEAAYAQAKEGACEKLMQSQFIENTLAALTVVTPKPGLLEEQEKQLEEELAATKATLSDAQIADLVQATADFNTWSSQTDPASTLEKFNVVDAETLNAAPVACEVLSTQCDGITVVTGTVDNEEVSLCRLLMDISSLSVTQMQELDLICKLSGFATMDHTIDDVSILCGRYLYNSVCEVDIRPLDTTAAPFLCTEFYCLNENIEAAAQIALETTLRTDLEDSDNLEQLKMIASQALQKFSDPEYLYTLARNTALADSSGKYALYTPVFGPDYYSFLQDMTTRLDSDPDAVVKELEDLRVQLLTSEGARIEYIGAADSTEKMTDILVKQLKAFTDDASAAAASSAAASAAVASSTAASSAAASSTAAVSSAAVASSASSAAPANAGYAKLIGYATNTSSSHVVDCHWIDPTESETDSSIMIASRALTDQVLMPIYRLQYGAYTPRMGLTPWGYLRTTLHRSPIYVEFLEGLAELPDDLAQVDLSSSKLNGYKLLSVSDLIASYGNYIDVSDRMIRSFAGITTEDDQALIEDLESATADSVLAASTELADAIAKSTCIVIASAADIDANADLFDEIYYFG